MSYLEAGDVRLHYRVGGDPGAPALVLSNSICTDLNMWEPQVPSFSSRFRLVRYDSRGHGRSDAPAGPYAIGDLGRDLVALLDALDIEKAHLCGCSIGSLTALWVAANHPERVLRAVFVSSAVKIGPPSLWDERVELATTEGMPAVRDKHLARWFSESFRRDRPDLVARFAEILTSTSVVGYAASCLALRDADLSDIVDGIRVPSLMISGAEDVATPPAGAEWIRDRIPGAELLVLNEAAHLPNVERPDRFNEAVLSFLEGP